MVVSSQRLTHQPSVKLSWSCLFQKFFCMNFFPLKQKKILLLQFFSNKSERKRKKSGVRECNKAATIALKRGVVVVVLAAVVVAVVVVEVAVVVVAVVVAVQLVTEIFSFFFLYDSYSAITLHCCCLVARVHTRVPLPLS